MFAGTVILTMRPTISASKPGFNWNSATRFAENTPSFYARTHAALDWFNHFMQPTDKELLIACRHGDESSWEALVDRYQRLIYTIPRRAGLNEDQAAEVFQEVFVTLFEKLNEINEPDRLHAWLVTTARRKTWRLLTKERFAHAGQIRGAREDEETVATVMDEAPLPDEMLVRFEQQHRVRTAVASLDERCRKLLTMLYYRSEPAPYSEIAAALGTSEGSIGPTRARCLQKLIRLVDDE